jgi:iron complex outermembrane receptor protein
MKKQLLAGAAFAALGTMSCAYAQGAAADGATADDAAIEEVLVLGQGEARQTQTLIAEDLSVETPGTSPIKLVEALPGVAVSGADTFGAYEWAVRINIRGFNQNQLGFTLDGVPLGDMSYGNNNGLHISRALISENLGRVELAQGSGALDVAAANNLGGALKFFSRDPSEDASLDVAGTYGSDDTWRVYGRVETGEIKPWGTRFFGSYVIHRADKWKGEGQQDQEQFAFKLVQPIGKANLTAYYNNSKRQEQDYQDLSLAMISRLGYRWDNFGYSQYALANRVADIAHNRGDTGQAVTNASAGTVYPAPVATADDAYLDASGLRNDQIGYLKFDIEATDWLSLSAQGYFHTNEGQGLWGTPYRISPDATLPGAIVNNAPLSIRTTEYDIDRTGFIAGATINLPFNNTLRGGVWIEGNQFEQSRRFYALDRAAPNRFFDKFQRGPFFTQWAYAFDTDTTVFYVEDKWQVTDRLLITAGFKNVDVDNEVTTLTINNAAPVVGADANLTGSIGTDKNFLPQAGVNFEVSNNLELFAAYSKNVAAFVSSATSGPFSSRSQANVDEVRASLTPETSQTFEGGARGRGSLFGRDFQASGAFYYVKFDDRLLAISQGPGIVGNAPILSNVGSVRTLGMEFIGVVNLMDDLSLTTAYSFNDSEYQDDVVNRAGDLLAATKGKSVVNTPRHIVNADLTYDDGAIFGTIGANYLSDRYFTYTNVGGDVEGRFLLDLSVGYRFKNVRPFSGFEAQLNISNALNRDYVGTLGTNGFVNAGDSQTLVTGAPRQIFLTIRTGF